MTETRLKEIDARLEAIRDEIGGEGADVDRLSGEADELIGERRTILDKIERRKQTLEKVGKIPFYEGGEIVKKEETRTFTADSEEYRCAFLKHIRDIELSDVEKRAFTSASSSAGAVIPTSMANEIITKLKQYAPLLNEITLLNVAGSVRFAVEGANADAALHTENATITAAADTVTEITLNSYEICKLIQISKTVETMSINAFGAWLVDALAEKIAALITKYLIDGTGTSQPSGIASITLTADVNQLSVAKTASLTATDVQSLIGMLGGGYDANAKFLMSKKTLFSDFMPLQDNAKNAIVSVQGGQYYIYGYPVMLDERVALHNAWLGDFRKIIGNLSEAVTIKSGFDIDTNSYKFLGCAMFDSKIADKNAFVKLTKATA